jgi:hypothetical protein
LKFNSAYTSLHFIPKNDPIYASIFLGLKNFNTITDNNKDYLYKIDKNMINFYSIENGQISKIKSLNTGECNHFLVVNDVLYTTDGKSIFKYSKTKKFNETIKTIKNEYGIVNFESLNENTLAIHGPSALFKEEFLYLLDVNTGILKTIKLPENIGFAIFDGFIAIAKRYKRNLDAEYTLDVDVYDTVNSISSFLF